jgi:hypothetical protein
MDASGTIHAASRTAGPAVDHPERRRTADEATDSGAEIALAVNGDPHRHRGSD